MDIETKLDLVRQVGEEILTEEELKELFETKKNPIAYDGFEPSGKPHIAQGIMRTINVNKMTKAGVKFKMLIADWFALMNNKLGGDMDKIRITGDYLIEMWKACGMDVKNVEFIWSKDMLGSEGHLRTTIEIARKSTIARVVRCAQIMGRNESEVLSAAQIFYPCMQAADIFQLKADIAQLGMDQRKVNMLAREVGPKIGFWKPVCVHHHMLMGLTQPPPSDAESIDRKIQIKMSKTNPDSAIFMSDTKEEIERKIKKAFCPEKQVHENPIMDYAQHLIFEKFKTLKIERPQKFGGDVNYQSFAELENDYVKGKLHPMDLKAATAVYINKMIEPVRSHFEKGKPNKLMEQVKSFEATR